MTFFRFFILIVFFAIRSNAIANDEKPIVLLITSYNNARWYKNNLNAAFSQNYSNFRIIYVDDFSTDKTGDLVEEYVHKMGWQDRVTLVKNDVRKFKLENFYNAVHDFCHDEEIVIDYDGDDWFINDNALSIINKAYANPEIWLTYGSYITWPIKTFCLCEALPRKVIRNGSYRGYRWVTSQPRTFYAWLFKKINPEDLMYEGKFIERAADLAYMFPLLEMSGGRFKFIKDVLYSYNRANPLNDNKVDIHRQGFFNRVIHKKPRCEKLKKSPLLEG